MLLDKSLRGLLFLGHRLATQRQFKTPLDLFSHFLVTHFCPDPTGTMICHAQYEGIIKQAQCL